MQNHNLPEEKLINKKLVEFAKKMEISMVATNEAFYLEEEHSRAHEILLCIGESKTINDSTRTKYGSSKFCLRSADEMWDIFGNELPEALSNTLKIAEICALELPMGDNLTLPNYPIPVESGCQTD